MAHFEHYENLVKYDGKDVKHYAKTGDVKDFAKYAVRIACDYEETQTLEDYLALLAKEPGVEQITTLIFGVWMEDGEANEVTPQKAIDFLVAHKDTFSGIEVLYIGDITSEENEMSWIAQGDMSAIWAAFPKLRTFTARGSDSLRLGKVKHDRLKKLVIQTGGMPTALAHEALAVNAPLEHLELWLGIDDYGADTSVSDFSDLLNGTLFPDLKYLGLRNSDKVDELAEALASSKIIDRIKTLDLSMGILKDKGAIALRDSGKLEKLEKVDFSHHYMSDKVMKSMPKNVIVDDQEEADEYDGEFYYNVVVGE